MAYFFGKGVEGPVQTNISTTPTPAPGTQATPGDTTGLCTVHADCPPGQMCSQGRCVPAPPPEIGIADPTQPLTPTVQPPPTTTVQPPPGFVPDVMPPPPRDDIIGSPCTSHSDCGIGNGCFNSDGTECTASGGCRDGTCQPPPPPDFDPGTTGKLVCRNGTCVELGVNEVAIPELMGVCAGKSVGQPCEGEIFEQICDPPCQAGEECQNGQCVSVGDGDGVVTTCASNADCPQGQTCINGRCEESQGWFEWPEELRLLYEKLMGRGQEVLDMPYGYTEEMMANMFGRDFEKVRGREAAQRETMTNLLSRAGMSGTGTELEQMGKIAWGTESEISNIMRDLFISGEEKKKEDIIDFSRLAQDIMGGGMQYNSLQEAINAARRGEGQDAMQQLLQFLMIMMQGWGQ